MKEFLKSPKKTAILGLVGSFLMLTTTFTSLYTSNLILNSNNLYIIGLIVYFIIILMRMYKQRGNIKIANALLITTYILSLILSVFINIAEGESILVDVLLFGITILYLSNILFRKIKFINNKIFAVILLGFSIYQIIRFGTYIFRNNEIEFYLISGFVKYLGYIAIVPYFYNYYELLRGGK